MAIHFQNNFDALLGRGLGAPIQVILDGRNSTTASLAAAELSEIINNYEQQNLKISAPLSFSFRAWYNPNGLTR